MKLLKKMKEDRASASVSAGVCILVSLALIFASLQIYEITSVSASSQEASDSSSLAAEGEVAKFYVAANTADAAILAMNVSQLVAYSIGVVAACSGNVAASSEWISQASKIGDARSNFSNKAKKALNTYQNGLPALAAIQASRVASENSGESSQLSGFAVLIPEKGEEIAVDDSSLNDSQSDIENNVGDIQAKGSEVAEEEREINNIKEEGYMLDCGKNPAYCLFERATSLSTLSSDQNPFYSTSDTWDFNVAFNRSLAYYKNRAALEDPESYENDREKSRSFLRRDYYSYCASKLDSAKSSHISNTGLYAWPDIYYEKDGFKSSDRYGEKIYPITVDGGRSLMHSNVSMSCASGYISLGSAEQFDAEHFEQCSVCEFSTNNTGNIGSATTNTTSGFEHYFQKLSRLARDYREKSEQFSSKLDELKELGKSFFDKLSDFFSAAKNARIHVNPPGSKGALSVVVDTHDVMSNTSFSTSLISSSKKLGTRVAFSGSTLEVDEHDSGASLICERIASVGNTSSSEPVANAWRSAAYAFADGTQSLRQAFFDASSSAPVKTLANSAGGKWALSFMSEFASSLGLESADLGAYKPVVASTKSITEGSDSDLAASYLNLQKNVLENSSSATTPLSFLTSEIKERAGDFVPAAGFSIGSADLPIIGEIDFKFKFDSATIELGRQELYQAISDVESVYSSLGGSVTWQ